MRSNTSSANRETARKTHFPDRSALEYFSCCPQSCSRAACAAPATQTREFPKKTCAAYPASANFAPPPAPAPPGPASSSRRPCTTRPSRYPLPVSARTKNRSSWTTAIARNSAFARPNVNVSSGHTISRYPSRKSCSDSKNIFRARFVTQRFMTQQILSSRPDRDLPSAASSPHCPLPHAKTPARLSPIASALPSEFHR